MDENTKSIIENYQKFKQVKAIAIGGSLSAKTYDKTSDIDVYIFVDNDIPLNERLKLIQTYSKNYEVGGEYFGSGDEFFADNIQKQFDVMFWNTNWFESIVTNTWEKYYPSNGYSTAFLYTLKNFHILYDTNDWLKILQKKLNSKYPKELKQNIINRNLMLMKDKPFASYYEQIKKAIERDDIVSINHRTAAFLSSYFDVLFAINELFHPGEKRLVKFSKENCKILPDDFEHDITELLKNPKRTDLLNKMFTNLKITAKNNF